MTPLLLVGDLHIGRLPTALERAGLDPREFSPVVAWERIVDLAARDGLDVVLAGDVVDEERDRFEAYGHLERGVRRLLDADVAVYAVAGNHDGIVLPMLADRLDGFKLLGAGGTWELTHLGDVDLLGWSFPSRHYRGSPLEAPGLQAALEGRRTGKACLAVLHADLDALNSPYAPVSREALRRLDLDACFVGHVHVPDALGTGSPLGYLGSVVGLNRGEVGVHGPWHVQIDGPGAVRATQVPVGPVQWERLDVDVSEAPDDEGTPDAAHILIEQAFRTLNDQVDWPSGIEAVGVTVRLCGRTRAFARISDFAGQVSPEDLHFEIGGRQWVVVSIASAAAPAVDLRRLAEQATPLGAVAQLLIELEAGGPRASEILEAVGEDIDRFGSPPWRVDGDDHPPDPVELVRAGAHRLLEALLAQQTRQAGP